MLLAPRQLRRHGMTGAVPYYGGRLTPAHVQGIREQARQGRPASDPVLDALTSLRDAGVITAREFDDLRSRVGR